MLELNFFFFYHKNRILLIRVGTKAQICILGLEPYLIMWMCPRRNQRLKNPLDGKSRKERMEG